jgi:hypothetical protein
VAAVVLILRLPTLTNRILSIDEASYLVHAWRLQSLEAFVYAFYYQVETKSQVGLIPYLMANLIDRRNGILLVHIFGLLAALLGCWLLIALARRFLDSALPGMAAALIWALYLVIGPGAPQPDQLARWEHYQAPRLEYFQAPFILAGLYAITAGALQPAWSRRGAALWAAAGGAWAVAALIKPPAILLGPLALAALVVINRPGPTRRATVALWLRRVGLFTLGTGLPLALVFGPYLFHPAAQAELWFNLVELNSSYTGGAPLRERLQYLFTGLSPLFVGLFVLLPPLVRAWRRGWLPAPAATLLTLAPVVALALFLGFLPGQGHVYYWSTWMPVAALTVTGSLAVVGRRLIEKDLRRPALALAVILIAIYLAPQLEALRHYPARTLHDSYLARDRRRFDLDGLVTYIQTHTAPRDKIWVYYNTPELYLLSNRPPATRDSAGIWLNYLWKEPWFERTLADLQAEQPAMIIGIHQPLYHYPYTVPLTEIPRIGSWVRQTYHCDGSSIRGVTACRLPP